MFITNFIQNFWLVFQFPADRQTDRHTHTHEQTPAKTICLLHRTAGKQMIISPSHYGASAEDARETTFLLQRLSMKCIIIIIIIIFVHWQVAVSSQLNVESLSAPQPSDRSFWRRESLQEVESNAPHLPWTSPLTKRHDNSAFDIEKRRRIIDAVSRRLHILHIWL